MLRAARALRAAAPQLTPPPFARLFAHAADPYGSRAPLPGVAHCVAVASGKGGVGKSTTAVNLAVACTALGLRVGLLDADVYGPSLPLLMGLPAGVPPRLDDQKRMVPPAPHGVPTMSMGLLLKGARPRSSTQHVSALALTRLALRCCCCVIRRRCGCVARANGDGRAGEAHPRHRLAGA